MSLADELIVVDDGVASRIDPKQWQDWCEGVAAALVQVGGVLQGVMTPGPAPTVNDVGNLNGLPHIFGSIVTALNNREREVRELREKVYQLEVTIQARDIALQRALDNCIDRIRKYDLSAGADAHANALMMISNELPRQFPAAVEMVKAAREHADCEKKIRELGSAIFPRMKEGE